MHGLLDGGDGSTALVSVFAEQVALLRVEDRDLLAVLHVAHTDADGRRVQTDYLDVGTRSSSGDGVVRRLPLLEFGKGTNDLKPSPIKILIKVFTAIIS